MRQLALTRLQGSRTNTVRLGDDNKPLNVKLQVAQTPWMAVMHPFVLEGTSQFRAPPPPALSSAQYATDLNETAAYGSASSAVRTRSNRRSR